MPDIGEAHAVTSSAAAKIYCAGNATKDLLHLSYVADEIEFPSQSHSNGRWTMNQLYHLQTIAPSSLSLSILMLGKNGYESYEIKRFVFPPQSIPRITWPTSSQRSWMKRHLYHYVIDWCTTQASEANYFLWSNSVSATYCQEGDCKYMCVPAVDHSLSTYCTLYHSVI